MAPVFVTALTAGVVALIPKALTDIYDYIFNNEEIQVKKKPDKTILTDANHEEAHAAYKVYCEPDSIYPSQQVLTNTLNDRFGTNKSVAQMMRICRGGA